MLLGGSFQLLVGRNAGTSSPASVPAMPRFILARVEIPPGSNARIPLDTDLDHGFVYILGGGADGDVIGGHPIQPGMSHCNMMDHVIRAQIRNLATYFLTLILDGGVYLFESGGALEVSHSATADCPLDLFIGAGVNMEDEPWVKLLGHNGFIIAKDKADAHRVMSKIDEAGQKFTYKAWD